jgi:hypothetical protein
MIAFAAMVALLAGAGADAAESDAGASAGAENATIPSNWTPIRRDALCTTLGKLQRTAAGRIAIDEPKVRAVAPAAQNPAAELRFTYLGPTDRSAPLKSGILRRQIGLKLRAQDSCNVVYVMWRIGDQRDAGISVQVKRNPGQSRHEQCQTRGYTSPKAEKRAAVARVEPGAAHTLRAELQGDVLKVLADGAAVWEGRLGLEILSFDGPVGIRSDNGRFELDLLAQPKTAHLPSDKPERVNCAIGLSSED